MGERTALFIKVPYFKTSLNEKETDYIYIAIDKIISFEEAIYIPRTHLPGEGFEDRIYTIVETMKDRIRIDLLLIKISSMKIKKVSNG